MSSLIEYDSNTQLEPSGMAHDHAAGAGQTNLLELAWQARWLLLLTVLTGLGAAWILLQRVEPRFTSVSRLYIERNMPRILEQEVQLGNSASYLYTQAELIRSTPVLAAAAEQGENASLETFRDVDNRVAFLRKNIDVQVGQNDDIINVSAELANSADAAQLVNSVVEAYISKYAEERRTDTVEVLTILRNEKQRRDAELEARRQELIEFRQQNAALAVQVGEENVITKRFSSLAQELDRVELELLDAKARYNRTKSMYETPSQRPFLLELASSQQQVANEIRSESQLSLDLENKIRDLDLQIASLQSTWGDGHPRVRIMLESREKLQARLDKQQADIEKNKEAIVSAYVETMSQEYQLLEQKRAELQRNYDSQFKLALQVNSQAAKLALLEESLARTARLTDILDERIKEVNLIEDVGAMNVSILEVAGPTTVPTYPNRTRFLGVGGLLGGLVGFGLAWLRNLMDHRLKSIDEIAQVLQLPVLGALPLSSERANDRKGRSAIGTVLLTHPRSTAAEAFRTLRTAIHFGLARDDAKIICVTSPSPGDGKSTVASNMAIAMAQADQRVLLIDADMRKPTQHTIFEVTCEQGLSTVLTERRPVRELIVSTEVVNLDLLPCGVCPANPVELLNNGFFSELLDKLRLDYDKIVIDSPPVMPVADARVIAAQTDATILVLRADRSTRRMSVASRDELWKVHAQRIGVVVNAVPARQQSSYSSGYGYGGYGAYGHAGGSYGESAYQLDAYPANGRRQKGLAISAKAETPSTDPAETSEIST
ncbi:polysaccharide biosynthesis tyrosine autokinase [Bythopirellula polymerisocia]|uniref:Tyrosine-protein kinase ptk n=1 Tax=Bythopirellula polymerisocia TaxID=2528003 RepID=A0A5C6CNV7_9BACT|nr:polysaccharide biosynthesis tyrosine autokinase [Bythopirellula polymerisocia]TWU25785.1 Tyrosine-protein kinase ptk [Bythopirellula polymerisocia]